MQKERMLTGYESARFGSAERIYKLEDQELLAVIHALKKWKVY